MQEILLYLLGVLVMVLGLGLSIGLHEIGHLVPAKLFGVRVKQYMIGFGRTLWSRKRGETEYGIKMLPLGGYISMTGMYPPKPVDEGAADSEAEEAELIPAETDLAAPAEKPKGIVKSIIDDDGEVVDPRRSFYALSVPKKIVIMVGGPLMNLVLGFVFFAILISGIGIMGASTTVGSVSECLKAPDSNSRVCESGDTPAPAAVAGLRPGDKILTINGAAIDNWTQVRDTIAANPGNILQLEYEREGTRKTTEIKPFLAQRAKFDSSERPVLDGNGKQVYENVGMLGLSPAYERQHRPITEVPRYVGDQAAAVTNMILHLPQRMIDVWNAAFSEQKRDANGPISVVGVGRIAGEIASHEQVPALDKVAAMVGILAGLNIALFIFNLIPLLPLDGGHVAGALFEALRRAWARLRGKPDPGPVDTSKLLPLTLAVVVVLGAMSVLLMYADIVKPITLG
ncbi:MAG: site-2 protease family protein [Microbacteriaceae bacterium]|nr:site-2 protease family protein [Microbacteriaceae bacterium]